MDSRVGRDFDAGWKSASKGEEDGKDTAVHRSTTAGAY